MSIIHPHIDTILIKNLNIDDLRSLYQVNKHYRNLLKDKLTNFIDFYSEVDNIELPRWIKHNKLFNKAIIFGKLDVCQYIQHKYSINIHIDSEYAFRYSCQNGHFDIAKWLYSLGNVNIHTHDEYAFRWSCINNSIEIAKWLYSLGNINIHMDNEYAFRYSCQNGHFDIAKWLYSLGNIDIPVMNDYAFRYSCKKDHFEIAKWLCSVEPRYQIEFIDDEFDYGFEYTIKN